MYVEYDAIGTPRRERRDEVVAAAECGDLVVGQSKQTPEHGAHGRLVVDDGDADVGAASPSQVTAARIGG